MLTFESRAIATIRAALLFWSEEIAPYGNEAARHYLDSHDPDPLTTEEVADLRRWLRTVTVRYAQAESEESLGSNKLFQTREQAELANLRLAAVLLEGSGQESPNAND